jgi:iron(III) transport system substrate-binding protein
VHRLARGWTFQALLAPGAAVLAAAACLGLQVPTAFAQTGVATLASYLGVDREQRLLEGAKKEAELSLYTSMQMESSAPLQKAFEEKYGVKIRIWRGSGKDILRRAVTEAQANRNDLDIVESDGFALEALYREALLQAVKSPYHADLIPEALRPQGQWVGTRVNIFTGVYNTNLVKPETLPKSYSDLLNPAFKGKLGIEADDYDWFGMVVGLLGGGDGRQAVPGYRRDQRHVRAQGAHAAHQSGRRRRGADRADRVHAERRRGEEEWRPA